MAETVGGTASRLRPRRIGDWRRQGYGLPRGGGVRGLEALIGDHGDALARQRLFLLLEGIFDARQRGQPSRAGSEARDEQRRKAHAPKMTIASPYANRAHFRATFVLSATSPWCSTPA